MIEDVDLQCFTQLFCSAGGHRSFYFLYGATESVIFTAADPYSAKPDVCQIGLLFQQFVI
ncbi:Uncharacterised protein [Klebsiella pneumoniae]|nr:Uncharacterised protein [Enterobacter cloacae]SYD27134.1 Uncharacterised protein [Klebsiella pneumoniae]